FDINLGCSGYVYGLSIVASLLEKVKGKALLLVGDASSQCVNPRDKSSAPLFSDAGSASALQYDDNAETIYFNLQTDGSGFDAIITPDGGTRSPINETSFVLNKETGRSPADMFLDGIKVFNFSRREVVPNALQLFEEYKIEKESIDYFVFHQANKLMNDTLVKKLALDENKVPSSLKKFGNTGSASIPLTLALALAETKLIGRKRLFLSGFGVGLSWGSCVLSTENCKILPLIDL
ncbi:MAG: 3-oxoacyl-[acyl-carrier-protein] synthase III C-terminal domain-containing protein, partial [Chitinophagales bacterium]